MKLKISKFPLTKQSQRTKNEKFFKTKSNKFSIKDTIKPQQTNTHKPHTKILYKIKKIYFNTNNTISYKNQKKTSQCIGKTSIFKFFQETPTNFYQ